MRLVVLPVVGLGRCSCALEKSHTADPRCTTCTPYPQPPPNPTQHILFPLDCAEPYLANNIPNPTLSRRLPPRATSVLLELRTPAGPMPPIRPQVPPQLRGQAHGASAQLRGKRRPNGARVLRGPPHRRLLRAAVGHRC